MKGRLAKQERRTASLFRCGGGFVFVSQGEKRGWVVSLELIPKLFCLFCRRWKNGAHIFLEYVKATDISRFFGGVYHGKLRLGDSRLFIFGVAKDATLMQLLSCNLVSFGWPGSWDWRRCASVGFLATIWLPFGYQSYKMLPLVAKTIRHAESEKRLENQHISAHYKTRKNAKTTTRNEKAACSSHVTSSRKTALFKVKWLFSCAKS